MSAIKIFHTADLHIGAGVSYLGSRATDRRFEIAAVFGRIVSACKENGVDICLIAGDLFDSNSVAADFSDSILEQIKNAESIKFFYVAGNHDPLDAASVFKNARLPENLFVFGTDYETLEFPEQKLRVIGRSFAHSSMEAKPFNTLLPDDDFINIMLLHADISSNESPYNPINRDFIENTGVDYLALGHIHKRTKPTKLRSTVFAYSGCPEAHGFDEEGIQGGYLGIIEKGNVNLSFVPLCRRTHRIEKIDVRDAVSSISAANIVLEKLKADYGENYADNLYKIILTGNISADVRLKAAEILQLLCDRLYFVKLKDNTKLAYNLETLKDELSLKGLFTNLMLKELGEASEEEKNELENALYLGLSAFDSEVAYNED